MKHRPVFFLLAVLCFLFLLLGNSQLAVTDPVESNYALTAKEMVLSGDWISPQIYGTYWFDKPIFIYCVPRRRISVAYRIRRIP